MELFGANTRGTCRDEATLRISVKTVLVRASAAALCFVVLAISIIPAAERPMSVLPHALQLFLRNVLNFPFPKRPVAILPHGFEHFLAFILVGAVVAAATRWKIVGNSVLVFMFAAAIELAQFWAPGRHPRVADFWVDAGAGTLGVLVICFLRLRRERAYRDRQICAASRNSEIPSAK